MTSEDDALSDEAIADAIAKGSGEDGDGNPAEAGEGHAGAVKAGAGSEEEVAKLKDQVLRLAAELENTRRRAERDKVDIARYAIANFARDLLVVTDNFERALHAAGEEHKNPTAETLSGIIAGLRMTEKELLSVLERNGVKRIYPKGEKFDPNIHQAVAQIPSDSVPTGHVVDVAQPGFMIKERVLRAAMVTVSSGGGSAETGDQGAATGAHVDTEV